jgi:hypothetical protein
MKKQTFQIEQSDEIDYLTDNVGLDDEEIYILSYLKGFNRKNLKEWNKKGLMDFSIPVV